MVNEQSSSMNKIFSWLMSHKEVVVLLGCTVLFLLLIFKDPFSERTLIPNFEPYPDTLFYIVKPLNFLKGEGFNFSREGRLAYNLTPPLYSIALIPFFAINPDPRMAYFANIFLSLISVGLFFLIVKKITNNIWLTCLVLFLYITNYFLYFMPTLVMAENLILPLYLTAVFLLIRNNTPAFFILLGVLSVCIYATKGANVPISAMILILSAIKIVISQSKNTLKIKSFSYLLVGFSVSFILYSLFFYYVTNSNILGPLLEYFGLAKEAITPKADEITAAASAGGWISFSYASKNFPLYLSSLLGDSQRFLWDNTPLVPKYIAFLSLAGLILGVITKRFRFLSVSLILMIVSSIGFLLTFYAFDARYIYIAIPSLLIGFSILIASLFNLFKAVKYKRIIFLMIILFFGFYVFNNALRIKNQISLNLKYAETPWYYISVLKLNEYFTDDKVIDGKKPVVISALPPFLVDFYSNGNYTLLPLSYEQELRSAKEITWGPNDYTDLPKLYTKYIKEGYDVYVSRYGLGNEVYTNRDFEIIMKEFQLDLVWPGCYEQCNIYTVGLK